MIHDTGADILGVIEAESRIALKRFTDAGLLLAGRPRYPHVMVVDGNDERGIDVGVLATAEYPLVGQRSHVDDADSHGRIFSRDCAEYHFRTPAGEPMVMLVNHLKSKGYGGKVASDVICHRQAQRIAEIYENLIGNGLSRIAVLGDLNDTPDSEPLAPLLRDTDLRDISSHPAFDDGGRPGTYGYCAARNKLDYVLLSPALFARGRWGHLPQRRVGRAARHPVAHLRHHDQTGTRRFRPRRHPRRRRRVVTIPRERVDVVPAARDDVFATPAEGSTVPAW